MVIGETFIEGYSSRCQDVEKLTTIPMLRTKVFYINPILDGLSQNRPHTHKLMSLAHVYPMHARKGASDASRDGQRGLMKERRSQKQLGGPFCLSLSLFLSLDRKPPISYSERGAERARITGRDRERRHFGEKER